MKLAWLCLGAGGLFFGCAYDAPEPTDVGTAAESLRDAMDEELVFVRLLNEHRTANGRDPVKLSPTLNQGAYDYSARMGEEGFFSHVSPDGGQFFERMCEAGYDPACTGSALVGENIAAGQETGEEVFDSWRNSPGHNENMLERGFRVIGIGRAEVGGSRLGFYWTNTFASIVPADAVEPGVMSMTRRRDSDGCALASTGEGSPTFILLSVLAGTLLFLRRARRVAPKRRCST